MIDQIGIALTGVIAVFLTQSSRDSHRRFACLFGMLSQPFWFYSAISAKQWGIVVVSCFYAVAWAKGIWLYWIQPRTRA